MVSSDRPRQSQANTVNHAKIPSPAASTATQSFAPTTVFSEPLTAGRFVAFVLLRAGKAVEVEVGERVVEVAVNVNAVAVERAGD